MNLAKTNCYMLTNILNSPKHPNLLPGKYQKKLQSPAENYPVYKIFSATSAFGPLPVVPRTNARDPGKKARKIEGVVQSYLKTDLTDGHVGIVEIKAGFLYFQMIEIAPQRIPRLLLESGRQNRRIAACLLGQFMHIELQFDMLFHICNDAVYDVYAVAIVGTVLRVAVYAHIRHQTQKAVQTGDHITDVIARIAQQKRLIQLLKDFYDIRHLVMIRLVNRARPSVFCIVIGKVTRKMNPINRPRIRFVRTVAVLHTGRNHKELIPADRMFHPFHFQPSAALLTKYEYILPGPVLAVTEMIFGIRIITDIGQVKIGGKTVFLKLLDKKFRKHYYTLALKAFSQF